MQDVHRSPPFGALGHAEGPISGYPSAVRPTSSSANAAGWLILLTLQAACGSIPFPERGEGQPADGTSAGIPDPDVRPTRSPPGRTAPPVAAPKAPVLPEPTVTWDTPLSATPVTTDGIASSARLQLEWKALEGATSYDLHAVDVLTGQTVRTYAAADATTQVVGDLHSGTTYRLWVRACTNKGCTEFKESAATSASTEAEVWRLEGSGAALADLFEPVPDSRGWPSAYVYGADAPPILRDRVRLLTRTASGGQDGQGVIGFATGRRPQDARELQPEARFGIGPIRAEAAGIAGLGRAQAVPTDARLGGAVRLFASVAGIDGVARIVAWDSVDGAFGLDFNPAASNQVVGADADSAAPPKRVLGAEPDEDGGGTAMAQLRSATVGWAALDAWAWDGRAGTPMVLGGEDTCNQALQGLYLARWNTRRWDVLKERGCARLLVADAADPTLVHRGGASFKLYYTTAPGPDVPPGLRVLYAEGARSGDAAVLDAADFEHADLARAPRIEWPDGAAVDPTRTTVGEVAVVHPTLQILQQVMYLRLGPRDTGGGSAERQQVALATLINP